MSPQERVSKENVRVVASGYIFPGSLIRSLTKAQKKEQNQPNKPRNHRRGQNRATKNQHQKKTDTKRRNHRPAQNKRIPSRIYQLGVMSVLAQRNSQRYSSFYCYITCCYSRYQRNAIPIPIFPTPPPHIGYYPIGYAKRVEYSMEHAKRKQPRSALSIRRKPLGFLTNSGIQSLMY